MKKSILLFISLLFCAKIFSQFYRPFPEGEAVWTISSQRVNGCPGPNYTPTISAYYSYIIQIGDTLINGKTYHKIYRHPIYSLPADDTIYKNFSYSFSDTGYLGGLRQDVSFKQVYVFLRDDSFERLLYDFSDDTLNAPYPNSILNIDSSNSYFEGIDTVWLVNPAGFTLVYLYPPYTGSHNDPSPCGFGAAVQQVEGFGNIYLRGGLIRNGNWFIAPGTTDYLIQEYILCFSDEGTLIYSSYPPNEDSVCITTLTAGFTELPGGYHLRVLPNPVSDYINITYNDLPAGHQYFFRAYNLLGQQLINNQLQPAVTTIPCNYLPPGMYVWKVMDEAGTKFGDGKLVKE